MILKTFSNNLSILPWYETAAEQNHRKSYAYGEVYPLYVPMGAVPPFQIATQRSVNGYLSHIYLHRDNGTLVGDITTQMTASGLTENEYPSFDTHMVIYPSFMPQTITTEEGRYYLRATYQTGDEVVSDLFTVVGSMGDFLTVRWWDDDNLITDDGMIIYKAAGNLIYRNCLWLPTQLGKPEYTFEDEGEERDGYFFPEKQLSAKRYRFVFLAPEYLCDVMRTARLSDHVTVTDKFGHVYRCDQFLITPKWEAQGDLASVEAEFTTNTIIKSIGSVATGDRGDFNDDFNNDFDIS